MTLDEYQMQAMTTCLPTSKNITYMLCNLTGEVGEFSSKLAKMVRKSDKPAECYDCNGINGTREYTETFNFSMTEEQEDDLKKEAGDIAWQLAGLCDVLGWSLERICQQNLDKLASRKQRNVIDGNGDNR